MGFEPRTSRLILYVVNERSKVRIPSIKDVRKIANFPYCELCWRWSRTKLHFYKSQQSYDPRSKTAKNFRYFRFLEKYIRWSRNIQHNQFKLCFASKSSRVFGFCLRYSSGSSSSNSQNKFLNLDKYQIEVVSPKYIKWKSSSKISLTCDLKCLWWCF